MVFFPVDLKYILVASLTSQTFANHAIIMENPFVQIKLRHIKNRLLATVKAYGMVSAILILGVRSGYAQAPTLSYASPQTYTEGTAITPLKPTSNGVAVVKYSSPAVFGNELNGPGGVAIDAAGNVYVADAGNNAIKMIPAGGGTTVNLGSGFNHPMGVALDAAGNVYVADSGNNAIKKIPAGGGTPISLGSGFNEPFGVAVDAAGNVYVADTYNNAIKKIPAGAGAPVTLASGFNNPWDVIVDAKGNLYISDNGNNAVKELPAAGGPPVILVSIIIEPRSIALDAAGNLYVTAGVLSSSVVTEILAGGGGQLTIGSGFNDSGGLAVDASGNVYVGDTDNNAVKEVFAGNGSIVTLFAGFHAARGLAVDVSGNVYVADSGNNQIKKIPFGGGDPVVLGSGFSGPFGVAVDAAGNVYVADSGDNAIKKIRVGGGPPVILGSGFNRPQGVAIDAAGNVYVADTYNSAIKKIPVGGGPPVTLGSGFPYPAGIAVDAAGNVYVAGGDNTIKMIPAAGGSPIALGSGYNMPGGVAVDAAGNVYIADTYEGALKKIPAGGSAAITLYSSDYWSAIGIAVNAQGDIYTAEGNGLDEFKPKGGYHVGPFLPAGLLFNENTGIISGTPTIGSPATNYTVTAYNSTGSRAANINIKVLPSNNASLSSLQINTGTLSPVFTSGTSSYTVSVPTDTSSITVTPVTANANAKVKVNGVAASGTASASIPLAYGANVISTVVTAEDGTTTQTYKLTVTRAALTALNNAHLSALSLTTGTLSPAFATGTANYRASVSNATSSIKLTPVTSVAQATVTVNGATVISGNKSQSIPLSVGANTINTEVTSQDGTTTRVYTVIVTRLSSDDNLTNLTATAGGDMQPAFNANTTVYTVKLPYSEIATRIYFTLSDSNATATLNGKPVASGTSSPVMALNVGPNVFNVIVTAQDGIATKTYKVTVTRDSSTNAKLSYLGASHCVLSPAFDGVSTAYTASVSNSVPGVVIMPKTRDTTATLKVNGITVASGSRSPVIPLTVGPNTVTTVVTAQDGVTTETYTLTITRAPSANAGLANLKASHCVLSPVFAASTTAYTALVSNALHSVVVTPKIQNATATVTVNGTAVISETESSPIMLDVGPNTITTVVTAQDKATTKTYTLTVTRAASSNANLANLKATGCVLSPAFAAATTSYTASVAHSLGSVKVTPIVSNADAAVTVNGATVASGTQSASIPLSVGPNTITTVVTAQDGSTTKTYTLTITRAAGGLNSVYDAISVTNPADRPQLKGGDINVHQGVSPNGDGINDFLIIENITSYPDNKLQIMNRNGQLIFATRGYDNSSKVFDGHSNKNGQMQLPGTYFYQLDYTVSGITKHKTGFIVLKY